MNTLTLFAVVAAFAVGVFGAGHGDHSMDEAMSPRLKVSADIKTDLFTFHASIKQNFPEYGEPSEPEDLLTLMKADTVQTALTNVKGYVVWSEISNCSTFKSEDVDAELIFDFTQEIVMDGNMTGPSPNMSAASSEPAPQNGEPNIFAVMYSTVVLQVNGINYCMRPEVENMGMKMIRLVFPFCADFEPQKLRETIHQRFGIDMNKVFVGNFGYEEGCHFADVYFQYSFGDGYMIKKIWEDLTSKSGLGRYSAGDKCMTNVRDSFFTDVALGLCQARMMADQTTEQKELPTCMGVSSQLASQYRERIRKYDCLVAEYAKKYGIKAEGCMKGQQQTQGSDQQSCNCGTTAEAELQNRMRILLTYVGAPLYFEDLYMKKQELSKMLTAQNFDQKRFEMMAAEIKDQEAKQAEYYFKAYFGMCMVSGHGAGAMAKLDWVRERVAAGDDIDPILEAMMKEAINYYLDMGTASSFMDQDKSDKKDTMKMKVKMLLGLSNGCSTVDERTRVYTTLMDFAKSIREHVETFNMMVDNDMVSNATRAIADLVEKNPEDVAQKIFLVLFSPMDVPDNDAIVVAVMHFFELLDSNKMNVAGKVREWMKDAGVMDLMGMLVMVMTPEDIKKECDLSELARMAEPPQEDMATDSGAGDHYHDADYHRDEYSMPRRRQYSGRRRAPMRERRPMYEYDSRGYYSDQDGYAAQDRGNYGGHGGYDRYGY